MTGEPEQRSTRDLDEAVAGAVRGLFGRDSIYMIVWAVQLVLAAVVTPVVTRLLAPSEFGVVAATNAVMQVLFVLAGLGLYSAIQRQYARPGGPRDAAKLLLVALVGSTVLTAAADLTGPAWSGLAGFGSYSGAVRLAVLWAGVSAVTNSGLALLRSQDRLVAFSAVSLLQSVVAEVVSLALVVRVQNTATMFVLGQLAVQVGATVLALALVPPRMARRADRRLVLGALAYGLPLIPAVLCVFVLNSADRLIVQASLGPVAVARYQVAYNIGALPILLVGVLNNSWMPRIFSFSDPRERAAVLAASRDLLLRILAPVILGLSVGAPIVLHIWAPPRYRPDELLLVTAVVVVSALPYTAALALTRALMAEGRTATIALAQFAAAVANVALNLLLIPRFGLAGSAAATFLAFALLERILLVRARALVPAGPPRRLVLLLGCVCVVALASATVPAEGVALAVRFAVASAALAWFTRLVLKIHRAGSPSAAASPV